MHLNMLHVNHHGIGLAIADKWLECSYTVASV